MNVTAYYIEVNIICIVILLIFQHQLKEKYIDNTRDKAIFNLMLWMNVLFCFADLIAGSIRGKMFAGAKILIEISNMIYFEALAAISFLWFIYVIVKLEVLPMINMMKIFILGIPFFAFTGILLFNPLTSYFFYVDINNIYIRNDGVYLHWIITYGYLMASTFLTVWIWKRTVNKQRRHEIIPLLYFIVAPTISSIVQMCFYGISSTQVGITLSLVLIFVIEQHNRVLLDPLTGLYNRRGLYHFIDEGILNRSQSELSLLMFDLNDFKIINDTYGHLEGDQALIVASHAIKQACYLSKGTYFICRYGGDEFLIAGTDNNEIEDTQIIEAINTNLEINNDNKELYKIEFSVGIAKGSCENSNDFDDLLKQADDAMYEHKKQLKKFKSFGVRDEIK